MTDTEHIYYDIDILNTDFTQSLQDSQLEFTETRNSPYIDKANDYFLSIVRFQISDTSSLPVFIPQIEPNQPDVNKTIYQLALTTPSHTSGIMNIEYLNLSLNYPTSPVGAQQENSTYYHVYEYQQFVNAINKTLTIAYSAFNTAAGGIYPTNLEPFFTFDNTTKKLSLYADTAHFSAFELNPIKIFINGPLKTLLNSFQFVDYGVNRNPTTYPPARYPLRYAFYLEHKFERGNIVDLNNITIPQLPQITYPDPQPVPLPASLQFYKETSQELDIVLWNPISSILFTSSMMPVVPTNTSTPSSLLFNTGNNKNSSNIITDFQVSITADNSYKQNLLYIPTSEYRLFSLNNTQPLNTVDIKVWWKDKYGRLNPFLLAGGSFANLKIMFRKKNFNNQ